MEKTMEFLSLAIKAGLPLIHVKTDDIINVEDVLSHLAGERVKPIALPLEINKISELKYPEGRVYYTSSNCSSLVKLYHSCTQSEKTIIFVNTEKSVTQFDGGQLVAPRELILNLLSDVVEDPESYLPPFAGLTLKDISEMAKMTMTRDEDLTHRGVLETRRNYSNLKGIQQVGTSLGYYVCPAYLGNWLKLNAKFFKEGKHKSLMPRGLLFDGPAGTGKTLASKYIASELGVPLYRLDLGAMMGKYVGDSEGALNAALSQIDQVSPCVILFDEVEKVFQTQGDGGVTSRLLSTLLWWLQEHTGQTMVIMTTNDVVKIPKELYREGRIDSVMEFLGIDSIKEALAFSSGILEISAKEVGVVITTQASTKLANSITLLFQDSDHVAQAKLTQTAYSIIRELSILQVPEQGEA